MRTARFGVLAATLMLLVAACSRDVATTTTTPPTTVAPTTTTSPPPTTTAAPRATTTTTPQEVVTIWADEATAAALESIGARFTIERGVAVSVETIPFASIRTNVRAAAAGGDGPDLFVGAATWTGVLLESGAVGPVRGLPMVQQERFIAPALEAFRIDGQIYGVPYAAETIALWINADLAGLDPPETFDDLLDTCDRLNPAVVCLAVAGGAGVPEAYYENPFLTAFGGSVLRYEPGVGYVADRAGIDEPESLRASRYLAALTRGDYVPPLDYVTAKQRFLEGEVAFWLTGYWEAEAIAEATENRGFTTITAPMPPIEDLPAQPFIDAFGIFLGANASTEAKILLTDWIATDDAMVELAPVAPLFPAHEASAALVTDRLRFPFLDAMRAAVPTPNLAVMTDAVWEVWGEALSAIRDERADPDATLQEAAVAIRRLLGIPEPTPEDEPTEE